MGVLSPPLALTAAAVKYHVPALSPEMVVLVVVPPETIVDDERTEGLAPNEIL